MLGTSEILEASLPEVSQFSTIRKLVPNESLDRCGEEGLPAMPGGEEPGDAVYRRAEVVAASLLSRARVKRHASPDPAPPVPRLGEQRPLAGECRPECVGGGAKGRAEGITDRLENIASGSLDGTSQDLVVAKEGFVHRLGVSLPHSGGASLCP